MRTRLTCKAWVQSLNTRDDCRAGRHRYCQKHESLSLYGLSTGRHLLGVSFIKSETEMYAELHQTDHNGI